ncbi:winged helix-turn-helix transcriptional regulator [Aquimarina rhabdastrellae]
MIPPENSCSKHQDCNKHLIPLMDTMELLSGKWKIIILSALWIGGPMRFNELKKTLPKITPKILSKELKFLEENLIITRTVKDTTPITVIYELSAYGKTLDSVLKALSDWGVTHRKRIIERM